MTSVTHKVFKHHIKANGLYNVKCVIYHNRKRVYVSTPYNVSAKQLTLGLEIKDKKILATLGRDEELIQERIGKLGMSASSLSASELAAKVYPKSEAAESESYGEVDFIKFSREYIASLRDAGKDSSANTLRTAINNVADFFGRDSVSITSITANTLRDIESFLSKDRPQTRPKNGGGNITTVAKGLGRAGIHTTMRDIRILFNAARRRYNTEFETRITHYPFDFYKVPKAPKARKKGGDLSPDDIRAIRDFPSKPSSVVEIGRDIFMLSLYLCGMNAKDIYNHDGRLVAGRLEYERSKTSGRRLDSAFISLAVPKQAKALLKKYCGGYLKKRYTTYEGFISAIVEGMGIIARGNDAKSERYRIEGLGLAQLTFYHARHTFATVAQRDCGYSTEEVARALNHVDQVNKVTAGYIDYDWSLVDRMQQDVIAKLGL